MTTQYVKSPNNVGKRFFWTQYSKRDHKTDIIRKNKCFWSIQNTMSRKTWKHSMSNSLNIPTRNPQYYNYGIPRIFPFSVCLTEY